MARVTLVRFLYASESFMLQLAFYNIEDSIWYEIFGEKKYRVTRLRFYFYPDWKLFQNPEGYFDKESVLYA
jgi:hypothetical protein